MLSYHWGSALELAQAAGQAVDDLRTPTRLALRAAGDRAFGLNNHAAAASLYDEALALWPDDAELPGLLYRRANALYLADDERALDALEAARDAQLAAGDRDTAALASVALAHIWWLRGRRDESRDHERRAEELVGGVSSPAAARVLAHVARSRSIGGAPSQGLELATQALEMAETFELGDFRAHALATIGTAKGELGDVTAGIQDLERALELAVAANAPFAGHIANNLGVLAYYTLDFRRMDEAYDEAAEVDERLGDVLGLRWIRAVRVETAFMYGRWDEAAERADAFIAECEAGSPHYSEGGVHRERGLIRLGRGDVEEGLADHRRAVALARDTNDPQTLLPTLGAATTAFETLAMLDEARELALEVVALARPHPQTAVTSLPLEFLLSQIAHEFESELRESLEEAPPWPWKDIAFACLDRDFVRAADRWAEAGSPTWEARHRLRAAEELIASGRRAEGEEQAAKALDFYRSVDASFYVDRCEALLREAKTA